MIEFFSLLGFATSSYLLGSMLGEWLTRDEPGQHDFDGDDES